MSVFIKTNRHYEPYKFADDVEIKVLSGICLKITEPDVIIVPDIQAKEHGAEVQVQPGKILAVFTAPFTMWREVDA